MKFEWADDWNCEICGRPNACKIDGRKICVMCFADQNREEYEGGHIIHIGGSDGKEKK